MFIYQTIIVYLLIFIIMFVLSKSAVKHNNWGLIVLAIIVYSIIFGLRYEVGVDYPVYLESYENNGRTNVYADSDFELGFMLIIQTLNAINAHYTFFFGLVAFLQIYLIFKTFKYDYRLYPYLVITFMFGCLWLDFGNGLRQVLALSFFIYSLSKIDNKHWFFPCLICLALAFFMHKSAIILLPVYYLFKLKVDWFKNVNKQYLLLCIAYVIGMIGFVQQVLNELDFVLSFLQYDHYTEKADKESMIDNEMQRGIGFYLILLADIILVSCSTNVKKYFSQNNIFCYAYNLYFVGILIRYAFLSSMMIQRVNYYFYFLYFVIGAYTLLYAKKNNKLIFNMLIFLYLLRFVGVLTSMESNTSLFRFFWQVN